MAKRTPEQALAYYEAKANEARRRYEEWEQARDLRVRLSMGDALVRFINSEMPGIEMEGLNKMAKMMGRLFDDKEWAELVAWWTAKGLPDGGYAERMKKEQGKA